MAVFSYPNISPGYLDAALWRAWGASLSEALELAGFVRLYRRESWDTVAAPSGINMTANVEVWRFNDHLQATAPIFFRLEYGSGTNAAPSPGSARVRIALADAWNGVDDISGPQVMPLPMTHWVFSASGTKAPGTLRVAGSADEGRVVVAFIPSTHISHGGVCCIERTRNAHGLTDEGAHVVCVNFTETNGRSHRIAFWNRVGGQPAYSTVCPVLLADSGSNTFGNYVGAAPISTFRGSAMPPPISILVTDGETGGIDATINVPMYGETRQYRQCGPNYTGTSVGVYLLGVSERSMRLWIIDQ